jgi:transposase InsO family protein
VIREAVRALRTEHPEWGPGRIAHELGAREKNPIAVGHNTVARILTSLGLSRPYEKKERSKRRIEITCPLPVTASDLKQVPLADGTTVFFMPVVFLVFRALLGFAIFRHFPSAAEVRDSVAKILSGSLDGAVFAHKTDNGTETKGAFREFLKTHGIFRWTGIPYWPRSNGVVERLIKTFDAEVLQGKLYASVEDLVAATVAWADRYNVSRPHEALGGIAPLWKALNWLVDPLERIRGLEVLDDSIVELVAGKDGRVLWHGESVFVGRCFAGKTVGLLERDGWISIWIEGVPLFRISSTAEVAVA